MKVLDRVISGLEAARRRSRRFNHVWCAADRFGEVLGGRLAAAIAYYAFFAAFGLALVAYSVLGFLLQYNEGVFIAVDNFLRSNLPWLEPATIQGSRGKVGVIGLAGLMITGSMWIEAMRSSQRLMHGVKEQPGNLITRRIVDLVILVALLIGLGISLAVAYALESLVEWLVGGPSTVLSAVGWMMSVAVNVVLASALMGGVPRLHLPARRLAPAVVFVAVGITLLNTVGQKVIEAARHNPAYTVVTGAVGLLLYLYLFGQLLLFGAALIATSPHGRVRDLALRERGRERGQGSVGAGTAGSQVASTAVGAGSSGPVAAETPIEAASADGG